MSIFYRVLIVSCFGFIAHSVQGEDFSGSFSFRASQRFYDVGALRNVSGSSSPWVAADYAADFGLFEWRGVEPRLGFGFAKNSSQLSSGGRFFYQLYTGRAGFRYKPYDIKTFFLIPYLDLDLVGVFGRGNQQPLSGGREKMRQGYELGLSIGGGCFISFLIDQETRHELQSEWDIKDYGLLTGLEWMKGGFGKSGSFYQIASESSFWAFNLGLMIDW